MENKGLVIRLKGYDEEDLKEWQELGINYFLYAQCYEEALTAVLRHINFNKSKQEEFKGERFTFVGTEKEYSILSDNSNIIAFIGDRGSGKTTAVNEFSRILCVYDSYCEKWMSRLVYKDREKYHFHVLMPIDASVLEAKEDLIEVILANMYQAFQKKARKFASRSELNRRIVEEFDDAYQEYINIGKTNYKLHTTEETTLARLQNTSNSLKTKNAIERLTNDFLTMLNSEKEVKDSYLVIVIDDLDMSPENGFEMLEQLHKYLLNEKIIILIAIKYEQMKEISNQHFADCLTPKYGGAHEKIFKQFYDKAKRLSSDYLLKVIPLSNRIYMPESLLNKNGIIDIPDKRELEVKEFVLMKIAEKMNIYYDAKGLKKHFCLPDTVRELVAYNDFLDSMYSMREIEQVQDNGTKRCMVLYDQNHERFNADLEYRMAMRVLDDDQLELFRIILRRKIERRARYAVNFMNVWMETRDLKAMGDEIDGQDYCHADLLRIVYMLGRKNYSDKALVHCILASFTTEMVREYYSYKHNIDEEARKRAAGRLKCFLGTSFGGSWINEWMPGITVYEGLDLERKVGYISSGTLSFELEIERDTSAKNDPGTWLMAELSDLFPCIECLQYLFSDFTDLQGNTIDPAWELQLNGGQGEEGEALSLIISSNAKNASFDCLGFIGKEIKEEEEVCNKLDEKMLGSLIEGFQQILKSFDYSPKTIKILSSKLQSTIRRNSIWYKNHESRNASFPFYNFDLSYNVIKRVLAKLKSSLFLKSMSVYDYLCVIYGYIAEELSKEESFYKDLVGEGKVPEFVANFVNSPCMKVFEISIGDKKQPYNQIDTVTKVRRRRFFDVTVGYFGEEIATMGNLDILD